MIGEKSMKMNEEQLIDLISKEVIRRLQQLNYKDKIDKLSILVIGDIELLNEFDYEKYNYYTIEDYIANGDIERYEYIIITKITNYELCDISIGRDSTPVTCAIQRAILLGKSICLMGEAISFYKYKMTSNPVLYDMLSQYVKKIEELGILVLNEDIKKIENIQAEKETRDYKSKVITELLAKKICKEEIKYLNFPKETIITPLAKDIFKAANKELKRY